DAMLVPTQLKSMRQLPIQPPKRRATSPNLRLARRSPSNLRWDQVHASPAVGLRLPLKVWARGPETVWLNQASCFQSRSKDGCVAQPPATALRLASFFPTLPGPT